MDANLIDPMAWSNRQGGERLRTPSLQDTAEQFEAIFVAQLLKVMRESGQGEGFFGDAPGKEIHLSMMDQELARELVRRGGFGLAEQIRDFLERAQDRPAGGSHEMRNTKSE